MTDPTTFDIDALAQTMLIEVTYNEDDDTLTLEWDENDPRAAEINTWTNDEWRQKLEEIEKDLRARDEQSESES